jgi:hypothetical protein
MGVKPKSRPNSAYGESNLPKTTTEKYFEERPLRAHAKKSIQLVSFSSSLQKIPGLFLRNEKKIAEQNTCIDLLQ